jgi:hypothetical protein
MPQQDPGSPMPDMASQRDDARRLLDLGQLSTDHLSEVANGKRRKRRSARLIVIGFAIIAALLAVSFVSYQVVLTAN